MKLTFLALLCCILIFSCSSPEEDAAQLEQIHCRIANAHIALADAAYNTQWDNDLESFTEYVNTNYFDELLDMEDDFQASVDIIGVEETHNQINQAIIDKVSDDLAELESAAITNGTRASVF